MTSELDLEADEQKCDDHLVVDRCVDVEEAEVVKSETGEQHPTENVAPDIDRLVGPPEDTLTKGNGTILPLKRGNARTRGNNFLSCIFSIFPKFKAIAFRKEGFFDLEKIFFIQYLSMHNLVLSRPRYP